MRRREQKKSSNYTELLEQQRKKFVEKAEQQVAKAALPPRCAVLQRSAQRCNIFVCCGKHVLLQQTTEEESVFVAEQKERQVTTARAVLLGSSWGYSRRTLRVLEGRGRAKERQVRVPLPYRPPRPVRRRPAPLCSSWALVSGSRPSVLVGSRRA